MNDTMQGHADELDAQSQAEAISLWIASEPGRRAISKALQDADEATSWVEKGCQVKRETLHEPVTV